MTEKTHRWKGRSEEDKMWAKRKKHKNQLKTHSRYKSGIMRRSINITSRAVPLMMPSLSAAVRGKENSFNELIEKNEKVKQNKPEALNKMPTDRLNALRNTI